PSLYVNLSFHHFLSHLPQNVGATRHLLETRLCPLCPHSTAQRELVNAFSKGKVFARTSEEGRDGCNLPLIGRVSPSIAFSAALINETGRQREAS
ncbi:hypothetical protein KUCAC02_028271, partial [Chaenocephalus aceratus]